MNKNKCLLLSLIFTSTLVCACNNKNNSSSSMKNISNSYVSNVISSASVIKSLVAIENEINLIIDEEINLLNYYEIEGVSLLDDEEKLCTYSSSDENIVSISNGIAKAINVGIVTITIISKVDSSKSCSFDINVKDTFIDHSLTNISDEDDFSNEWNEEGKNMSFRTKSMTSNRYYIKGINSKEWYVETFMSINEIKSTDKYPKMGIMTHGVNSEGLNTMVAFYLNAKIGENNNTSWYQFGATEMYDGHYGWENGYTNTHARYNNAIYNASSIITFSSLFKMGLARINNEMHLYINNIYAFTYKIPNNMEILYENGNTLDSRIAFFQFNSDITFSDYKVTEENVRSYIPKENINYCFE